MSIIKITRGTARQERMIEYIGVALAAALIIWSIVDIASGRRFSATYEPFADPVNLLLPAAYLMTALVYGFELWRRKATQ